MRKGQAPQVKRRLLEVGFTEKEAKNLIKEQLRKDSRTRDIIN